mgnify:CR=1 FL=1
MNHDYICPVEATLEIVGGKYKPLILWHLSVKHYVLGNYKNCFIRNAENAYKTAPRT